MFLKRIAYLKIVICAIVFLCGFGTSNAQHTNTVTATLDTETKEIRIQQEFVYINNSKETLTYLYFNDWANAYSNKKTPLARKFEEEFKKNIHLAKDHERGHTNLINVVDANFEEIKWKRTPESDLIKFNLNTPLIPSDSIKMVFTYVVKLPSNKFTTFGYSNNKKNNYYLKDWYLTPAVYNGEWQLYSNKDLDDLYTEITNTTINFTLPNSLFVETNSTKEATTKLAKNELQTITIKGTKAKSTELIITSEKRFTKHITPFITLNTDLTSSKYEEALQTVSILKITEFIEQHLGKFPHKELLVSKIDYNKSPLYGINQLPSFIRPYEERFQFELKFLKTALNNYLKETLYLNPRKEKWVIDALVNYLMIVYVEDNYPNQKLLGKLSGIFGFRNYKLAKMDFNDQYALLSMLMARKNLDQSLSTPNDSLLKFNQKISSRYKAGLGLAYLASYIGEESVKESIKTFYAKEKLKEITASNFRGILEQSTEKNINWFFDEYVSTSKRIDFKIKKAEREGDSIRITLKNKSGTNVPISLFGLKNDSIVSNYWFSNITKERTVTIPKNGEDRLVLNYDHKIPEFNQRDNWKSLGGFFSRNKKLKFQFFKDVEDPNYTQVLFAPILTFNAYDGFSPGIRLTNKTFLRKRFIYNWSPSYSFKENTLVGYGKFTYTKDHNKGGLYVSNYSLRASTFHFQTNSRYTKITPSVSFGWRPKNNLISNKRKFLSLRYVNVLRQFNENLGGLKETSDPDYSVLNARFVSVNNGIINHFSWYVDAQHSSDFTKLAVTLEYRKLFESNRQFNVRFFAGKFLRNKITNSDFFSFALDRPTDYLFDYNFLGRSEGSGLYSQQIIIAEGGFKSKLPNAFANDWMATVNTSLNIWRWVEFYSDFGFIKSRRQRQQLVYDSGIRLNLVTDYFELYFPLYSNNGWEVSQPNYEEKIRFVVTLSPKTLLGLFKRKWF
ncbi:MAG: metalloprotease [Cellulophaga sp.]